MRKILGAMIISVVLFTSCGNNIGEEALGSGKAAIENKQFEKADAYFEIALEKGIDNEEVKVLRSNIRSYIDAVESLEKDKVEEASEILNLIDEEYKDYALKEEIDELKEKVNTIQNERKETYEKYKKQLDEIEYEDENSEELKKLRRSNMLDMKKAAAMSYTMWDEALNDIYKELRVQIPQGIMEIIQKEQIAWISYKELKAKADSFKYYGGSMEGLEYMSSLGETTKIRCYELLEFLKIH